MVSRSGAIQGAGVILMDMDIHTGRVITVTVPVTAMAKVTTAVPPTKAVILAPAMITVIIAAKQASPACSKDSLVPATIAALSMGLWAPEHGMRCARINTIVGRANSEPPGGRSLRPISCI